MVHSTRFPINCRMFIWCKPRRRIHTIVRQKITVIGVLLYTHTVVIPHMYIGVYIRSYGMHIRNYAKSSSSGFVGKQLSRVCKDAASPGFVRKQVGRVCEEAASGVGVLLSPAIMSTMQPFTECCVPMQVDLGAIQQAGHFQWDDCQRSCAPDSPFS
jgi:hypothetical protein